MKKNCIIFVYIVLLYIDVFTDLYKVNCLLKIRVFYLKFYLNEVIKL